MPWSAIISGGLLLFLRLCERDFAAITFYGADGISAFGNGMVATFLVGELWQCFVSSGYQLFQLLRSFMPCLLLLPPRTEMSGRLVPACTRQCSKTALATQHV